MIKKDDSFLPLYCQIVAMEAIELHKLEQIIVAQGGVPLERNTDAILYRGNQIDISNYFWDAAGTVAKYRYDEASRLARANVCSIKRAGKFELHSFEYIQLQEPTDNNFLPLAKQVVKSGKSCGVFGVAGAGKTTLANTITNEIESSGMKCIKLAPTNKAASHINGMTIHKFYLSMFLSNNYEKKLLKSLNNVDYIIVDEFSMVREIFYRFFVLIKRYVPNVKFIVIGDFRQLKPVNDVYTGSYKDSPALHQLCDGQQINLTRCRRSDAALFNLYTNIESVDTTQFPVRELTELNIAYTHKTRKNINRQCMDKFSVGKEWIFAHKSSFNKKTQTSKLFVGMPIVAHRNFKKEGIFNSELFTISHINFQSKTFSFVDGDTTQTFPVKIFSSMFFPGFCLTAHTSQGCTFNTKYTIYDWNHPRMDQTAKYVALSRATSIQNIQINL
jgi:ATP-dependent exoDNAse (exonuclease V) alpha subunit